jgi:hypothetical protein
MIFENVIARNKATTRSQKVKTKAETSGIAETNAKIGTAIL